jgi:IS30 family transposase
MIGMKLPKIYISVIFGKHISSIYREIERNSFGNIYTGREAQQASDQRRVETKPSPKLNDPALMGEVDRLFKKDLSPEQISGRLDELYPDESEKQVSVGTIYKHLYRNCRVFDQYYSEHRLQSRPQGSTQFTGSLLT